MTNAAHGTLRRAQITGVLGGTAAPALTLTATTTAPNQTVTLQRITPIGADVTVFWGDGSESTISDGNTGTTTHQYAAAGTYEISVTNSNNISVIYLNDNKLTIDTNQWNINLDLLSWLELAGLASGSTFNSLPFAGASALDRLYLDFLSSGTYNYDSNHFSECPLTTLYNRFPGTGTFRVHSDDFAGITASNGLLLSFAGAGDYAIDSADFAGVTPVFQLSFQFSQPGTYSIDTSHFASASPIGSIRLIFDDTTLTATTAQADWQSGLIRRSASPTIQLGLTQAQVDDVLLGIYGDMSNRTASNGTLNVAGNNAAPSGTLAAECSPTAGKNAAYELVNDSCGIGFNPYAAVTINT